MKKLKKCKLLFCTVITTSFLLFLSACNNEIVDSSELNSKANHYTENGEKLIARNKFAQILAKALQEKEIREFIKNEALKEIDGDYDVIYHYVKDKKLANDLTFRENIAKYSESQSYLDSITNVDYTLSIFVPYLNERFSPYTWDTDNQTPKVVVRSSDKKEKLKAYGINEEFFTERSKKPTFPVIVVKENERLIDSRNKSQLRSIQSNSLNSQNQIFAYFRDNCFDNRQKFSGDTRALSTNLEYFLKKDKLYSSVIKNKDCVRDFIYYNISSNQEKGTLDPDYRESIKSITFVSPSSLAHVADKYDPTGDWTKGNLELLFDFIFVDKDGSPLNINKMASVRITDLFDNPDNPQRTLKYIFPNPIDIFNWDVYTYGNIYKIVVSEFDPGTEIETTQTISSSFGMNWDLSGEASPTRLSLGPIKIGLKFGGSSTKTKQNTVKIKSTNNSDPLGDILVNYFDPIFTNDYIKIQLHAWRDDIGYFRPFVSESKMFKRGDYSGVENWVKSVDNRLGDPYMRIHVIDITGSAYNMYNLSTGMVSLEIAPRYIYK